MSVFDNFEFDMSDDAWADAIITSLPAIMNQDDDSNNQKLLRLLSDKQNYWKNNKSKLKDNLSYLTATGQSLTDIAAEYGVNRIDDDDEFLRFQIRLKIYERMFGATEQGTKQFIAKVFGIGVNDFNMNATDHLEEIEITNLPFEFPDDDRKEQKQEIISRSIQDNLPPTFKLKDIVYTTITHEHLYYGTINDTSLINKGVNSSKDLLYRNEDSTALTYGAIDDTSIINEGHNDNRDLVYNINTSESLLYAAYTDNDYISYETDINSSGISEISTNAYLGLSINVNKEIELSDSTNEKGENQ